MASSPAKVGKTTKWKKNGKRMAKEKIMNGNVISKKFETMLPLDVSADLTRFAKVMASTGLGKFDYGVALRILLERNNYYEVVSELQTEFFELQAQFNELKHQFNKLNKEDNSEKKQSSVTFRN